MVDIGCMNILNSFPSSSDFSVPVRTQAITGLKGFYSSSISDISYTNSGIEPIILATAFNNGTNGKYLQREAVAALRNLALGEESNQSELHL
jgi:hypothetical protein